MGWGERFTASLARSGSTPWPATPPDATDPGPRAVASVLAAVELVDELDQALDDAQHSADLRHRPGCARKTAPAKLNGDPCSCDYDRRIAARRDELRKLLS